MNPILSAFLSGDSLYLGTAILLLAIFSSAYTRTRRSLLLRNVMAWLALAMIILACPPFPWLIDLVFLAAFVSWFIAANRVPLAKSRSIIGLALALVLLTSTTSEFFHRLMPKVRGVSSNHLVVIGDSISSGIGPGTPAWPEILQQETGVPVKNLAVPGATVTEAQSIAKKITPDDHLILLEIGGNDLLSGVPGAAFEKSLQVLLSEMASPGRTVVMFELPLFPNKIRYGQAQRALARKYGVFLIPKRFLVEVIGGANATSDGLHLSTGGAHRVASLVAQVLSPVLESPSLKQTAL